MSQVAIEQLRPAQRREWLEALAPLHPSHVARVGGITLTLDGEAVTVLTALDVLGSVTQAEL